MISFHTAATFFLQCLSLGIFIALGIRVFLRSALPALIQKYQEEQNQKHIKKQAIAQLHNDYQRINTAMHSEETLGLLLRNHLERWAKEHELYAQKSLQGREAQQALLRKRINMQQNSLALIFIRKQIIPLILQDLRQENIVKFRDEQAQQHYLKAVIHSLQESLP